MTIKTAAQALGQITSSMTVAQLRTLASEVDVGVGNTNLILYSGGVGTYNSTTKKNDYSAIDIAKSLAESSGGKAKTILDTERAKFLESDVFRNALKAAASREGQSFDAIYEGKDASGNRINNTSFWDDASKALVENHTGDYYIVMPNAPDSAVGMATEIPALLNRSGGGTQKVNGRPLSEWKNAYSAEYTVQLSKNIAAGKNLAQAGIREFLLGSAVTASIAVVAGHAIPLESRVVMNDGSTRKIGDAWFAYDIAANDNYSDGFIRARGLRKVA